MLEVPPAPPLLRPAVPPSPGAYAACFASVPGSALDCFPRRPAFAYVQGHDACGGDGKYILIKRTAQIPGRPFY